MIYKINMTNSLVDIHGISLTELLARRDVLKLKIGMLRNFLNTASAKLERYSRTEIKILSTVNVTAMQKDLDALSKELRETDEAIQEANWTNDLR